MSKHLRTVRQNALRTVLRAARDEPNRESPRYVSQRTLASHVERTQPWLSLIESLQRRCDVLEFIDLGDSLYNDRTALFKALIDLAPRRYKPIERPANTRSKAERPVARRGKRSKGRVGKAAK